MSDKNLTVFVDNIGRTVIGEVEKETKSELVVVNPAIIHVVPNQQTGQISVQLLPFFFKEFTRATELNATWTFNKAHLTVSKGINLDDKIISQYKGLYSPIVSPESAPVLAGVGGDESKVVKLFDD
tara:strand:+ start:12390 stop:12767 length:378 start_codon:yes stop_codon:yes gene_type:complete